MFRILRPILDVVPHRGIGAVRLGAHRADARDAMRQAGFALERCQDASDYYAGASLLTECDDDGRIWFVEVRPTRRFIATLYGRKAFSTPARELFEVAASRDHSGHHAFDRDEYLFPNQTLAFWHADAQYNPGRLRRHAVWGAIGVGNEAYAGAIAGLQGDA